MSVSSNSLPIAVLISGGGTTLFNLIEKIEAGQLNARIVCVVSSSPNAGGLQYAADAGIPSVVVQRRQDESPEAFSKAVFAPCREAGASLVVMGGFLKHVLIPSDFENRVMNIHPSLIPAFCGQGFYGSKVHQAVLDSGAKESGCTVHFVDNQYDHGPIILQRTVEVRDEDTPKKLAERIFEQECQAYPEAIELYAASRLQVENRLVRVLPSS